MCEKKTREKKKGEKVQQKPIWATAQTVSRYNGKMYRDIAVLVCSGLRNCVVIQGIIS